jgi:hypothetical protein
MASVLYPLFKEALLTGAINLTTDTVKAVLVDTADYTYSASHQYLSDVPLAAREEITAALGSKTVALGVFDAADTVFTAATGDPSEALILFKDTGTASTSPLIAYVDSATGLPVILNGGDITLAWNNGANKIFAI